MYSVGENFLENITKYGRQFDTEIHIEGREEPITVYDINTFGHSFNAGLFQSVMRILEIDSNIKIEKGSILTGKLGIKFEENSDYDYIDYENYKVIEEPEYDEDVKAYITRAYDKMVESMVDYDLAVSWPVTVRNFLIKLCERLGWDTSGIPAYFVNSDVVLYEDVFSNIKYTYRDVLDEIAKITCSFPCFINGLFTLKYITETEKTIDDTFLDEDNLSFEKEFFVNSVVFARSEDSDTYYKQDVEDVAQNGLHEYKLSDLQILCTNNRADFMIEIYRYMRGLRFWICDIQTKGVLVFDIADRFTVQTNGNNYSVVLLNSDIKAEQGIYENMYAEEPKCSETEYKYSTSDEKRDNLTKLQVDKVNQKITAVVSQIGDRSEKSTTLTQDIEQLQVAVSEVTDMTRDGTGNNTLHITDTVKGSGYILDFAVFGNTEKMYFVTPEDNLVPGELVPNRRSYYNSM